MVDLKSRTRPQERRAAGSLALTAILLAHPSFADYRQDIGHAGLVQELGLLTPTGAGVAVVQVEAPVEVAGEETWLPDPAQAEFAGKTIANSSGAPAGLYSSHATGVGRAFYGNSSSIAPGIVHIAAYGAEDWVGAGYLRSPAGGLPRQPLALPARVANHSWVGSSSADGDILRRTDWAIHRDEFIHAVGLTNGGSSLPLMASAFNIIAVGRTDGGHGSGSAAVDGIYTAGRVQPHVVVPSATTSQGTAWVSAAAAMLAELAASDPALATDPVSASMTTRVGSVITNAGRSAVIKAALMAGALRHTFNTTTADILDYRGSAARRSSNGLDTVFGAGQLHVGHSYWIIAAGEQNSREDQPDGNGAAGRYGFDYDPRFGGRNGTNATGTYVLPVVEYDGMLAVTLAWNLQVAGGIPGLFNGTAELFDLDLVLLDVTDPGVAVTAGSSTGTGDNTENLWVPLRAGRQYAIEVRRGAGQPDFDWPYALAWRIADDRDGDGIADDVDNCTLLANAGQLDADGDGFGNACDADFNGDGAVNFADLATFRTRFGTRDAQADLTADGVVNFADLARVRELFGRAPGPSARVR
jgi:hypothetical protein